MSPAPCSSALAHALLQEWETATHFAPTPAYRAARPRTLALLTDLSQFLLANAPLPLDAEDVRSVLQRAATVGLGTAVAHGASRAGHAAAAALAAAQAQPLGPVPPGHAVAALLCLLSGPSGELEMDELTQVLETIQTACGPDVEMVFGHDIVPDLVGTELRVWLLVGYAATNFSTAFSN